MHMVHFWATAAAALVLANCVDRKANRLELTTSASAARIVRPGAEAGPGARNASTPVPRWGSKLLRFEGSSRECEALVADTERRLEQVRDPFDSSSPDESAARVAAFRTLISQHTSCVPSNGGAWATFFEGGEDPRTWAWFVGFLPTGSAVAKHAGNFPEQFDQRANHALYTGKVDLFDAATYRGPYRLQVVSDYDGDGTPEAAVWTAQIGQEVRSSARGMLWSFAHGMVAPYSKADTLAIAPFEVDAAAAAEPAPLFDLDADGRIDLLGYAPFFGVFKQGCGVIESFDAFGPRLVLHALADGSFSNRDAVARAHAKTQCPTRPPHVLAFGEHGIDRRATFSNLACSRLWNVSGRAIESERNATCGNAPPSLDADCDAARKCSAEALTVLAAWAQKQPPFTLKE